MKAPPVLFYGLRSSLLPLDDTARLCCRGFTTVELVVIIGIVGILAAVAVARFVDRDSFASRGFFDEAINIVRHAKKTAIAWRREVCVSVTANSVAASSGPGCGTPLTHPSTGAALAANAPNGVALTPVDFRFDALGRLLDSSGAPSPTITVAISSTIAGDTARQIVIQAETGYVQ